MMKVSDPIMFGIAVEAFYKPVLDKHRAALDEAGFDSNNGIGDLYARLPPMPADVAAQVTAEIDALYGQRPGLASLNSDKGITNLHVPSDLIVDASMRSDEHTSELQSLMRNSYAVFCLQTNTPEQNIK